MARAAVRVALEIVLVLRLGFPEVASGRDCRHSAAWPQARGVDVVYCLQGLGTLKALFAHAGMDVASRGRSISVEEFLTSQRFVPQQNAALRMLIPPRAGRHNNKHGRTL